MKGRKLRTAAINACEDVVKIFAAWSRHLRTQQPEVKRTHEPRGHSWVGITEADGCVSRFRSVGVAPCSWRFIVKSCGRDKNCVRALVC